MDKPSGGKTKKLRHYFKDALLLLVLLITTTTLAFLFYDRVAAPTGTYRDIPKVQFDDSITDDEKNEINAAFMSEREEIQGTATAKAITSLTYASEYATMNVYVPVTNWNASRQSVTKAELASTPPLLWHEIDDTTRAAIGGAIGLSSPDNFQTLSALTDLDTQHIALIPISKLDSSVKLLKLDDAYYLDTFNSGAVFRMLSFVNNDKELFSGMSFGGIPNKDSTLSFTQTGVTALTRMMSRKLASVGDPKYFSAKIGSFLSSSDITHVSNEVSFMENCEFSTTAFCSDPRFIETLKDSGVDVVELTGNHNNDRGRDPNSNTINLYRSLGWHTVGGGLNTEDAAKYYVADQKNSKVALLAYNYPDSPNGGAIATATAAGANSFDFDRIASDIKKAKTESNFVIVNVQYWECYSYPDGYVEFPVCDKPTGKQEPDFKKLIDLGADMVVGSSAHQPQYYEIYNGKPIYYGLGNLYFDQTQWPGTERGIILTHYFIGGKLIQTKLSPTRYDESLQTALMPNQEAESFLARLLSAR